MTLYLAWNEDKECCRDPHEDDGWDQGDFDLNPYDFRITRSRATLSNYSNFSSFDEEDVGKSDYWVVYVIYTDGNTFGDTSGNVDAFWVGESKEIADVMYTKAKDKDFGYFGSIQDVRLEFMQVE